MGIARLVPVRHRVCLHTEKHRTVHLTSSLLHGAFSLSGPPYSGQMGAKIQFQTSPSSSNPRLVSQIFSQATHVPPTISSQTERCHSLPPLKLTPAPVPCPPSWEQPPRPGLNSAEVGRKSRLRAWPELSVAIKPSFNLIRSHRTQEVGIRVPTLLGKSEPKVQRREEICPNLHSK